MKKALISIFLMLSLVFSPMLWGVAYADESTAEAKLSPAFDVIAARQTMIKSGLLREKVQFTETDFKQSIGVSSLDYITVTKAPDSTDGILVVGSMTVRDGQKIDASLLSMLNFVPSSDEVDVASFVFCGDGRTSGAELKCTLRLCESVNYAPTIASVDNTSGIVLTAGESVNSQLSAVDPEGDTLTYEIISYPENGVLKVTDASNGEYTYTSYSGFSGRDSFEFVARDDWGNYTTPSTVYITVK